MGSSPLSRPPTSFTQPQHSPKREIKGVSPSYFFTSHRKGVPMPEITIDTADLDQLQIEWDRIAALQKKMEKAQDKAKTVMDNLPSQLHPFITAPTVRETAQLAPVSNPLRDKKKKENWIAEQIEESGGEISLTELNARYKDLTNTQPGILGPILKESFSTEGKAKSQTIKAKQPARVKAK